MRIHVLFFAYLRDAAGGAEAEIEIPEGATLGVLREAVVARWPALAPHLARYPAVVNGHMAAGEHALGDGDEVAWLPPVAGGAEDDPGEVVAARIGRDPIDPQSLVRAVASPAAGAVALFLGTVRDREGGRRVVRLEYEAYDALAQDRLRAIAHEAAERWPGARVAVAHRVGSLAPGEISVAIAVATAHRDAAFDCCRHLLERIKKSVPLWKRSRGPDGDAWVEGTPYEAGP